jgi:hypothetical protein
MARDGVGRDSFVVVSVDESLRICRTAGADGEEARSGVVPARAAHWGLGWGKGDVARLRLAE